MKIINCLAKYTILVVTVFLIQACSAQSQSQTITTASGLIYEVVDAGEGPVAKRGDEVLVHEIMKRADGTVLSDTWKMGHPARVLLGGNQAIDGVDEALTGMRVGERRKLIVPPSLSKRTNYPKSLSPDDTLYYDVNLVEIIQPENIHSEPETSESGIVKSGLEMVFVAGGDYIMGGSDDVDDGGPPELRVADECPHPVEVSDFSIGKYEVTRADWVEIMDNNPSPFTDCADCPVDQVSWNDVQEFIKRLNAKSGEQYRLPTEEEWEFAARGGLESENYLYAGSNEAEDVAWYDSNSESRSHPVGMLNPNELGLYDMSGNIWEWTSEAKTPYVCDTIGKRFDSKVLRGGTYRNRVSSVRVRDRNGRSAETRLPTLGFRLAK